MFDLVSRKIFYLATYNWIKIDFMDAISGATVLCERTPDYPEDIFAPYRPSEVEKVHGKLQKWISNKELEAIYS